MTVTLNQAMALVQKALRAAEDQNLPVVAVVADTAGNTVAMARMDGVGFINTEVARKKALASATFGQPTHDLVETISRDNFAKSVVMSDPQLNILPGGMPILDDNEKPIGGLGIAGGYYLQDRAIAEYAMSE